MSLLEELRALLTELRQQKRAKFIRHVGIGDLLSERTDVPREYGWGEGTTCYDNVLILGNVSLGRNCWVGPNVILDGSGGDLVIGDHVDISAGVQIYTHHTVRRALSAGTERIEGAPTQIGSRVYIGPNSIIQKGVTIGDDVIIGAMSFVGRDIPAGSRAWGIPARVHGKVDRVV